MMSFEFNTPSRIIFGRGQIERLADLGPAFGSSAMLVHAGIETAAPVRRIVKMLEAKQVKLTLIRQHGEPKAENVDSAAEKARRLECDVVIGLGGGSAIDAAKAIAGLLGNGGNVLDYVEVLGKGKKITRPAVPWIAIPTTAGTGAEATRNAVISTDKFKVSMRSEHLLPRLAIVDPELTHLSWQTIAASGMDALCQLIESYTSSGATAMTDTLALEGIRHAAPALRKSYERPGDVAGDAMAFAAILSGITLTNAGLGAVHGFAAPIGAHFDIPHGVVCAALLPPVIAGNVIALSDQPPTHPVLERYATIGRIVADHPSLDTDTAIAALQAFTNQLVIDLHIPPLKNFGMHESHIPDLIFLARQASSMKYNPVELSDDALAGILRAGIAGYPDAK
jgi:alcohol dehydrogenase class IV